MVDDLVLLDGKREQENLLEGFDLAALHKAAELGHRDPSLFVATRAISATPTTATSAAATETTLTIAITVATVATASTCALDKALSKATGKK